MTVQTCRAPGCDAPLARINRTKNAKYEGLCTMCRMEAQQETARENAKAKRAAEKSNLSR